MSDFQLKVGGDFNELLRGFQQLESRAQQSGAAVGKGIADGIQGYSSKSIAALQAELNRLEQRQIKVAVDSSAFQKTGERIQQVKALIAEVERRRLTLSVDDRSITALQTKLAQLQSKQTKLDVDSTEFADAQREINALEKELNDISRKKLLIDADPKSIIALRAKLSDLQDELQRTEIGSQRFRELTAAIQATERELSRAGESADQFRILDGVVQGIAFSLSNAVVNGAQQAIAALGNLIGEFGRLDTELRKAAAAGGEAGGYDRLARAVDQVGIEAAGTQLEVAQLATELVRGGLTISQTEESLAAIVRGAEATGTSFAQMGSVVSASLKGFGLEAKDASRVVDALVQGANAAAADVTGMGNAFKYAAPVAKILGVSVEDLGLAVGLLTNAGIDASEAGVTLRNGLSKLASAAPQAGGAMQDLTGQSALAAKAMRSLGVDIYNTNGTLKPMEKVLLQLKGAFEKLDPASKIRLAANLFGGEDDGAKWLALLNQSESEIRRLAEAMANTKGATDVANDAMSGFEKKLAQLNGTLGSIGNTFGAVAATALIPFIDAANVVVGLISSLPGPVKATVAAVTILTGSLVAATAGMIAFQAALASTQVQSTIAGLQAFALALRTQLAGAATVAIVAIQALYNAIRGFTFQSFFTSVAQLGTVLKTQLAGAASVAALAFSELGKAIKNGGFAAGIKAAASEIAAFAVGAFRLVAVLAPLAIGFGIVSKGMEGASHASERYKTANDQISTALIKLRDEVGKTNTKIEDSRNIWERLWDSFSEGAAVMADSANTDKLIKSLQGLQSESKAYLDTLNKTSALTDQQISKANAYVVAIQSTTSAIRSQAAEYEQLAKKAELVGDEKLAEVYRNNAKLLREQADGVDRLGVAIANKTKITAQDIVATGQATQATKERADAERELNQLIATAPVRKADAQLAIGQQLLSLSQALSEQEQSQFNVKKAALEYELNKAQERKASEGVIRGIKEQIIAVEKEALFAKGQALANEQALQTRLLQISQEKARLESNLAVFEQRAKVIEAEAKLQEAINQGKQAEIQTAEAQVNLQNYILGIKESQRSLLEQTQPLEREILATQQATAQAGLDAQAAQLGVTAAISQSADAGQRLAGSADQALRSVDNMADSSGVVSGKLADATGEAGNLATGVNSASKSLDGSAKSAATVTNKLDDASDAAAGTGKATGGIGTAAEGAAKALSPLLQTMEATRKTTELAVQLARQFSAISGSVGGVAKAMVTAADAARSFLNYLTQASGLPGSRWTGGPVEAGQSYRINDGPSGRSLGQESFLTAAGQISLINRPANSLWRAPTSGIVIPAGVTDTLKARGVFDSSRMARSAVMSRSSGDGQLAATVAQQAVAIGKLEQAVNRLTDKDWNVHLKVRNTDNGSAYLNQLHRML